MTNQRKCSICRQPGHDKRNCENRKDGHTKNNCPTEISKMIQIDLNQVFNSSERLEECIRNIRNAKTIVSLKDKTLEEKIMYSMICIDKEKLKDKMKNENFVFDRNLLYEYFTSSEYILYYYEGNIYYRLANPKQYIEKNLPKYMTEVAELRKKGETDNMWKFLSEVFPMLINNDYKRIIPPSCYERKKTNHSDAIIYDISSEKYMPCEHKYTDSGGVRQTFNGFVRKSTYVTSLNNKEEVIAKLLEGQKVNANFDIYNVNCEEFFEIVEKEINDKKNRRKSNISEGNGRFDVTNMIQKIEDKSAFISKETVTIQIRGNDE